MYPTFFPSPIFIFLKTFLFLSIFFQRCLCAEDEWYSCTPFSCGNFGRLGYPFWGNNVPDYCGHPNFKLDCQQDNVTIDIKSHKYRVIDINYTARIMKITSLDMLSRSICPKQYSNTTLDFTFFDYTERDENATFLFDCHTPPSSFNLSVNFTCPRNKVHFEAHLVIKENSVFSKDIRCNVSITVPVLMVSIHSIMEGGLDINGMLEKGFEIRWTVNDSECKDCTESGGRCGHNVTMDEFRCFCPDETYERSCYSTPAAVPVPVPATVPAPAPAPAPAPRPSKKKSWSLKAKVIVGVCTAFVSVVIMSIIFFIYFHHYKKRNAPSLMYSQNMSSTISSKEPENGSIYFKVHLFTYNELEEATDNFDSARELGDGGFGTVYYGKLQDGRTVAVKRLYENNYRRVEQFMNEVEILTRLRHKNLVSLYGCTSRHGRELLLVYEYIPNGTVADHLHGERAKPGSLPWSIRMNIAIETACALAYLHASDTIHRDVKTNNILLDNNFSVKVADFGLSRLFPNHVTHISTAPQGTPGYVDPEYHECYQLTDKSDVFSFGVVLIELISSMPAVDITRHRHEINLSNMAINKIQNRALHELVDTSLGYESDYKVRKMINAVAELAFRCLQSLKDMRPSMVEVLEVLEDIQNDGSTKGKPDVMDISKDDAALLKSGPPPASPDSVTSNIKSTTTTPNASG